MDVTWYINRLRVMDARELVHRVRERLNLRALERAQRHPAVTALTPNHEAFAFCASPKQLLPRLEWDIVSNDAQADDLLEGRWPALGYPWQFTDRANCWHHAPDTGAIWPTSYFNKIPYRPGNSFGDARVVWEPSRLQQLVSLALLTVRHKHRAAAVAMIERQLASWIQANPPYSGVHYVSAMECALRLIAVCHAVDLVRGYLLERSSTWRNVIALVASHARLIHKRLSLHSSSGNHTIAEAVGLIYAGVLFKELEHAAEWRDSGRAILATEYKRQVLADGGGAEQAPAYLALITDLAELAQRLLAAYALDDAATSVRIALARRFLHEVAPADASTFGDSDGGYALSPFLRHRSKSVPAQRPRLMLPDSGYTILRSHRVHTRIVFDHGRLGMPPMYAHGHADALSVTLRHNDDDLLIDPGTHSYSNIGWRSYFRSTRAHNTVTVDDDDQAQQVTPFIWRHPYHCTRVKCDAGEHTILLAMHDGYRRVGVTHWRGLIYDHAARLVVWDYLIGRGAHRLSLWWHLGTDATVIDGTIRANNRTMSLSVRGATQLTRHRGSTNPIAGWRSPHYGVKTPATSIESTYEGSLPHEFLTTIRLGDDASAVRPDAHELRHLATLRRWVDEA